MAEWHREWMTPENKEMHNGRVMAYNAAFGIAEQVSVELRWNFLILFD